MTTLSPITLGSILKEAIENKDIDTVWWVIDDLEGKNENT